ncbi:MAG: hypothetical protein ACXWRU_19345 [Pseudobdellovibrionaceae bacterium]
MKKLLLFTFISLFGSLVLAKEGNNISSLAVNPIDLNREQLINLVRGLQSKIESQNKNQNSSQNLVLAGGSDSGGSGGGQFLKTQFLNTADELVIKLISGKIALVTGVNFPVNKLFEYVHGLPPQQLPKIQVEIHSEKLKNINTGEEYSAFTENGVIKLYQQDWEKVEVGSHEFRRMVLHELCRIARIPDDSTIASTALEAAAAAIEEAENNEKSGIGGVPKLIPPRTTIDCEGGVAVACKADWENNKIGGPTVSLLDSQSEYVGQCFGRIPYCD